MTSNPPMTNEDAPLHEKPAALPPGAVEVVTWPEELCAPEVQAARQVFAFVVEAGQSWVDFPVLPWAAVGALALPLVLPWAAVAASALPLVWNVAVEALVLPRAGFERDGVAELPALPAPDFPAWSEARQDEAQAVPGVRVERVAARNGLAGPADLFGLGAVD